MFPMLHGISGVAAAPGFVGAYDAIPDLVHVYEPARRTLSAYEGILVRLRRSSDNAELDFGFVANGDLDTAAITTWLGGASGLVVTVHDQVGIRNLTQATASLQQVYVASGQNGHPTVSFDGVDDYLRNASVNVGSNCLLVFAINSGGRRGIYDSAPGSNNTLRNTGVNSSDWWNNDPSIALGISGNTPVILMLQHSLTPSRQIDRYLNGDASPVTATSTNTAGAAWNNFTVGTINTTANPWSGALFSIGLFDVVVSSGNREAFRDAVNAYWSIY